MRPATRSALAFFALLAWAGTAPAADAERGRNLYETRCDGCHAESVHGREKRAARDFEALRGWVRLWSVNLHLGWTDAEVNDVAAHLNARYYRFACPPADCMATGSRGGGQGSVALGDRFR